MEKPDFGLLFPNGQGRTAFTSSNTGEKGSEERFGTLQRKDGGEDVEVTDKLTMTWVGLSYDWTAQTPLARIHH
jgi:hypothetical protein